MSPQRRATKRQKASPPPDPGTMSLQRAKPTGQEVVDWIEKYCHIPEGKKVGQLVQLEKWQKKEIKRIYDNKHGTRRAILSFPRKNAKTSLSAFLLLAHLCGPCYVLNSQLYSTAQSREQAGVIFQLAAKVVRMSSELRQVVTIRDSTKELLCVELGTKYRALSAEASTAFGLSPAFIVHDELGQVRGPRSQLYEALETATGAQEDPLSLIISTQAPSDNDLLSILIDDALAGHDPRTIVSLYTAPKTADPFAKATIKKANPAFGTFLNAKEVLAMAEDAKRMPAREAEYRNLVLNQRVEINNPFVTQTVWETCGATPAPLDGLAVYGGLDLSSVADLTALVLIGKKDRVWQVHPTFWLPAQDLREKAKKDRVPYDLWQEQGFLQTTEGNTISYEFVAEHLFQLSEQYNIRKIGFDRWNMKHLVPWLIRAGFPEHKLPGKSSGREEKADELFVEFGQGTQSMSPALRDLEGAIKEKELAHGNHPVLAMCAACAVIDSKDDANRKLSKNKSTGRIDGLVALTMAMGVAGQYADNVDVSTLIF